MSHSPNFLETPDAPVKIYRPRRWLPATLVGILILAGLLALGAISAATGIRAYKLVREGKVALEKAEELGSALDFDRADYELETSRGFFLAANTELKKFIILRHLPYIGRQIRATESVLESGILTIDATRELLDFGRDLMTELSQIESARFSPAIDSGVSLATLSDEEKRKLLAQFVESVPKLEAARQKIDNALAEFNQIPTEGLVGPLKSAIAPVAERLPRMRDDIDRLVPLAKLLPTLAGYPTPKHSLILFLNNSELRPGGGFIGTVGRFDISDATILNGETADAYSIDRPAEKYVSIEPPAPLKTYLGLNRWFMRDANWSPDFAVSAERVAEFYERETSQGEPRRVIDNVIGFTPSLAEDILRITGPIKVEDQTFTADNLYDTLEYQVEKGFTDRGVPFDQRKEILVKLVDETVSRLLTLPASRWEEVLSAIDQGFREKQIMIYDRDQNVENLIDEQGYAGSVDTGDGDFFMAVDANLGSLKSDPFVKRTINYQLSPDGEGFRATVSITYRHEGRFDWKTTRYRTYTRLYVPPESEFISATGTLRDDKIKNPTREAGEVFFGPATDLQGTSHRTATVFGAFTSIEPGEERTMSFTYRLPSRIVELIKEGEYSLKAQKQLGAEDYQLTLDLDFGKTVRSASPPEPTEQFFDTRYRVRTDLAEDREFEVGF